LDNETKDEEAVETSVGESHKERKKPRSFSCLLESFLFNSGGVERNRIGLNSTWKNFQSICVQFKRQLFPEEPNCHYEG
jgi:hypothetical protein